MNNRHSLILLPKEFVVVAKANRLSLEELLTPKQAKTRLSMLDLSYLYNLQNWIVRIFSKTDFVDRHQFGEYREAASILEELLKLDDCPLGLVDDNYVYSRMFASTLHKPSSNPIKMITLYDTPVCIIEPGQFMFQYNRNNEYIMVTEVNQARLALVEELLAKLYLYLPQAVVHSTVWYRVYIDLLQEQALAV